MARAIPAISLLLVCLLSANCDSPARHGPASVAECDRVPSAVNLSVREPAASTSDSSAAPDGRPQLAELPPRAPADSTAAAGRASFYLLPPPPTRPRRELRIDEALANAVRVSPGAASRDATAGAPQPIEPSTAAATPHEALAASGPLPPRDDPRPPSLPEAGRNVTSEARLPFEPVGDPSRLPSAVVVHPYVRSDRPPVEREGAAASERGSTGPRPAPPRGEPVVRDLPPRSTVPLPSAALVGSTHSGRPRGRWHCEDDRCYWVPEHPQ